MADTDDGIAGLEPEADGPPPNPVEWIVRRFDCWQQRHTVIAFPIAVVKKFGDDQAGNLVSLLAYYSFLAAFPLLLAFTAVLGVALRRHPELHQKLVNSAFAEFPIVGGQIHDQLGVEAFTGTFPLLMIGVAGALLGGRGFAHALQNTLNTVWAVPKVDRPGLFPRYLRTISLLLLLSLIVVVTGAASTAAGTATSLGVGGLPARIVSLAVGTALGFGFFLVLFRVAASGTVSTRSMLFGAAISALGWQILLTVAGIVIAHQLRHAQAVAGVFGVVLGLLAWLALQATVIVYAIEADVVRARHLWPRSIVQPPLTDADKSYYTAAVRAEAQRPEQRIHLLYETDEKPKDHSCSTALSAERGDRSETGRWIQPGPVAITAPARPSRGLPFEGRSLWSGSEIYRINSGFYGYSSCMTCDAFVLGGGGLLGAAEVGMARALLEAGVRPDLVCGTSVGAINGAAIAADPTAEGAHRLLAIWGALAEDGVLDGSLIRRVAGVARGRASLHGNGALRRMLHDRLPAQTFEELAVPFECVAASIEHAREHWFTTGDLIEPVLASCALPGVFPPVRIGDEHFFDGGLVNSIPLDRAVARGADTVWVLHVGRLEEELAAPRFLREVAFVAFEISRRHRFQRDLERVGSEVTVHVLPTGLPQRPAATWSNLRYRDTRRIARRAELAHDATREYLEALR